MLHLFFLEHLARNNVIVVIFKSRPIFFAAAHFAWTIAAVRALGTEVIIADGLHSPRMAHWPHIRFDYVSVHLFSPEKSDGHRPRRATSARQGGLSVLFQFRQAR